MAGGEAKSAGLAHGLPAAHRAEDLASEPGSRHAPRCEPGTGTPRVCLKAKCCFTCTSVRQHSRWSRGRLGRGAESPALRSRLLLSRACGRTCVQPADGFLWTTRTG